MRSLVRIAVVTLMVQALTLTPAMAGWMFWKSDKKETPKQPQVERKTLFEVPDDQTEKELLTFLRSRELVTRDVIVLQRLVKAKQAQFADIQERLQSKFNISPTTQYEYDSDTMTVYEAATEKMEKKEFRKFTERKEGAQFLEMLGLKRRLDSDIMVLQRVEKEQSENLVEIHNALLRKYGIRRDRQYQYDKTRKTLYEVNIKNPSEPKRQDESKDDREKSEEDEE
jgi:multidrug efflux pump subunit AcrB